MSNETISMPRGLAVAFDREHSPPPKWAVDQLRALLAQPALAVKQYGQDSVTGHSDVEVTLSSVTHYDHGPNVAEALARLACRVARFYKLEAPTLAAPTEQHQDEPVAYTTAGMLEIAKRLPLTGRVGAKAAKDSRWSVPLYTQPPQIEIARHSRRLVEKLRSRVEELERRVSLVSDYELNRIGGYVEGLDDVATCEEISAGDIRALPFAVRAYQSKAV